MSILDIVEKVPDEMKNRAFNLLLMEKSRKLKIPTALIAEITPICTLNCKMCYSHLSVKETEMEGGISYFDYWSNVIKQCVEMGVLHITFTGGEAMTHPDFIKLYEYAYGLNTKISIMTNGTTITQTIIDLFKKMKPSGINLTIYGFSSETYEKACGDYNAFQKVLRNIQWLKNEGILPHLQCTVTHDNIHELPSIYAYAQENGLTFMYDSTLKAARNCTKEKLKQTSVTKEELEEVISIIKKMHAQYNGLDISDEYIERYEDEDIDIDIKKYGTRCGMANNMIVINWKGEMIPCLTLDVIKIPTKNMLIRDCWQQIVSWGESVLQIVECQKCKYRNQCHTCIAYHFYDTGVFGKPSPRICKKIINSEEFAL